MYTLLNGQDLSPGIEFAIKKHDEGNTCTKKRRTYASTARYDPWKPRTQRA